MGPDHPIHALIIVDVQNDFCPGGSLAVPEGNEVVPIINNLMGRYEIVFATRDYHESPGEHFEEWPHHCVIGTSGADYHKDLRTSDIHQEFLKGRFEAAYSGFDGESDNGESLFLNLFRLGVSHVTVVGLATDFCVKATALDAVAKGFTTTVLLPATRAIAAPVGESDTLTMALEEMRAAGVTLVEAI